MKWECDFVIDKITNSIERASTGESLKTEVTLVTAKEVKTILKKNGWRFDWKKVYKIPNYQVYKLTLADSNEIQGFICTEIKNDENYMELKLIEVAPHNFGKGKMYVGVPANLVAFTCCISYELGFDGEVAFTAKTSLVDHYIKELGAELVFGTQRMIIRSTSAKNLILSYYKDYFNER